MSIKEDRRVLVVDDNRAIHEDFRKILQPHKRNVALDDMAEAAWGDFASRSSVGQRFEVDSAYQGQEALACVQRAAAENQPYAVAFLDVRMPPGWDGLETAMRIWQVDPRILIVFCTAYSDYSWRDLTSTIGDTGRFLLLKKPFENLEVLQLATFLIERLAIEEELNDYKQHLEEIVLERTAELAAANEKLEQANVQLEQEVADRARAEAAAEAASVAKGEFLASMSHEIRTPMTAIMGFTDLLIDNVRQPENRDAIQTIKRNGEYLLRIINDILDLSRIEAGKLEVESRRCSPGQVVADVLSLMSVRADVKNLLLEVEFQGLLPETIQTDPLRLRQILINLLGNAIKFTDAGSVRIAIRLLGYDTAEPRLRFDVIDTGIGVPPDRLTDIFDPFSQSDLSPARRLAGTGLGLSISKRLAEMLGGDVSAQSELGKGSTFSLTIATGPLQNVRLLTLPGELPARSHGEDDKEDVSFGKLDCRVLLVEDGPDTRRLITFILEKAGVKVDVAENGRVGVEKAMPGQSSGVEAIEEQVTPFDLILMDMHMPVMDGYEATRHLRNAGCTCPIVALTANAMRDDELKCLSAGCDAYLSKPIDRTTLLKTVEYHTQARRM